MTAQMTAENSFVEVDTAAGRLRGIRFHGVESFLGIPYGATTAGSSRFVPPRPAAPWTGVREALAFGDAPPQVDTRLGSHAAAQDVQELMYVKGGHPLDGARMSEDCLNLNVWTPGRAGKRPVMVWFHGGGFQHGSAGSALYHGDRLAALGDVVVITVNARLGITGFLPLDLIDADRFDGAANAGVLDLVAALTWVRDNVAGFGGDPGNVTIFGQPGGGGKVNSMLVMPAARGLAHRAINMSGPMLEFTKPHDAERVLRAVLDRLDVDRAHPERLLELPLRALLDVQASLGPSLGGGFGMAVPADGSASTGAQLPMWGPTIDGRHLPEHPFPSAGGAAVADVPMLIGWASHDPALLMAGHPDFATLTEGRARDLAVANFGASGEDAFTAATAQHPSEPARLRYARVVAGRTFRAPALAMADAKARQSSAVYCYEFAHQTDVLDGLLGACHSLDLPFAFANVDRSVFAGEAPSRHATSRAMALAWAAFARTGNPGHEGIPDWPAYDTGDPRVMRIDAEWTAYRPTRRAPIDR
ncbi:carboxylesterase/lipase family protein [Humibacter antri]